MNVVQIIFSPTGGTQKVADLLCRRWNVVRKIDLSAPDFVGSACSIDAAELVVIAVPSFGGRVPALAAQRLRAIAGNQAKCITLCVYGNRAYEDTLLELNDLAAKVGFQTIASVSAIAEHSIARAYGAGRPDAEDAKLLDSYTEKIEALLSSRACCQSGYALKVPGNHPYKEGGKGGPVPAAGSQCAGCGVCAARCPVQAIDPANPRSTDAEKCIGCMRCIAVCPHSARSLDPQILAGVNAMLSQAASDRKSCELFTG